MVDIIKNKVLSQKMIAGIKERHTKNHKYGDVSEFFLTISLDV